MKTGADLLGKRRFEFKSRVLTKGGAAKSRPVCLIMCEAVRLIPGPPQALLNVAGISAVRQRLLGAGNDKDHRPSSRRSVVRR
jgi:hypothetical protein